MAADLGDVMDDIGVQLATVTGLRVFDFPPNSAQPPFAFVNLPSVIEYDMTFGRGADKFTIEVWVGVANVIDRAARDALAGFAAGAGTSSIKAAIEASDTHSYRVQQATFETIGLAGATYAGIIFTIEVGA